MEKWVGPNNVPAVPGPRYRPKTRDQNMADNEPTVNSCNWPSTMDDGQWHCLRAHVRMNDIGQANLITDFYIDDQLCGQNPDNIELRTSADRKFRTIIWPDNHDLCTIPDSEQAKYLDNLVISSTPIYCDCNINVDITGSVPGSFTDFSEGLAALGQGETLCVYPGIYRETDMEKNGYWSLQGIGDRDEIILTAATPVDESQFTDQGSGIYHIPISALGTSSNIAVIDLTNNALLKKKDSMDELQCPYAYAIEDNSLYVYLEDENPNNHELEIVDLDATETYIKLNNPDGDIQIRNVTFRGAAIGQNSRILWASTYSLPLNNLIIENVIHSMSDGPLVITLYGVDNLELRNVDIPRNHNINHMMPFSTLVQDTRSRPENERHYLIEDCEIGPHAQLGYFGLLNPQSSLTIENTTVISAGMDHTGISVYTAADAASPGSILIKNSIFASHDIGIDRGNPATSPYDCGTAAHYEDCAHDFAFSPTGDVINVVFKNNLFAYGSYIIQFQDVGSGSTISAINNIFINGLIRMDSTFEVEEWDHNLYWNYDDIYGDRWVNFIDSVGGVSDLNDLRQAWNDHYNCPTCDSHSINEAPELVNWQKNFDMIYDFTPTDDSNACGAGKNGVDIGPISCVSTCIEIDNNQLMEIIQSWKTGSTNMTELMNAIKLWKVGCP